MASRGVNKVILLGNVGQDPECRTFSNGDPVANFSLATSETWNDRQTGEPREKTEWHRCVAYRGLAGVIQQYVRKGSKLYVEGKLQTRKWTDQNGLDRYSTEIVLENMQMLDSRNSGQGGSGEFDYRNEQSGYGSGRPGNQGSRNNQFNNRPPQTAQTPPTAPVAPQDVGMSPDPDAGMSSGFADDEIPF